MKANGSVFNVGAFQALEEMAKSMAKIDLVELTPEKIDVEYDEKGDALYIAFTSDTVADNSELIDNDILLRYRGAKIIGMTILHFSERRKRTEQGGLPQLLQSTFFRHV